MKDMYKLLAITGSALLIGAQSPAFADGTETLGPANIAVATGTDVLTAGTGLIVQPGQIDLNVPNGATVEQVLIYWEGQSVGETGDDTIEVDGIEISGTLIGGPTQFFSNKSGDIYSSTYRADITDLDLVSTGANSLTVTGLDFSWVSNGAGILVIIDDGSTLADIQIRDGNDLAYINLAPTLDTTVPQTYSFAPSSEARVATLSMFFSTVEGSASGGTPSRPSAIDVTIGGVTTTFNNLLDSADGDEWDTLALAINIPAFANSLTVQALSVDNLETGDLPASFAWNAASLSLPTKEGKGCKKREHYKKSKHHKKSKKSKHDHDKDDHNDYDKKSFWSKHNNHYYRW